MKMFIKILTKLLTKMKMINCKNVDNINEKLGKKTEKI